MGAAFEGYAVTFPLSPEWMESYCRRNDIQLELSRLWTTSQGEPLAFALLGLRGDTAWVGAFGLATALRGRRLARPLLDELLEQALQAGATRVQLEVLQPNPAARHLYASAGFKTLREVSFLFAPPLSRLHEPQMGPVDPAELPPPDPALIWQRQLPMSYLLALQNPRGWVRYRLENKKAVVAEVSEAKILELACREIQMRHAGHEPTLPNESVDSPLYTEAIRLGWRERARQEAMELELQCL